MLAGRETNLQEPSTPVLGHYESCAARYLDARRDLAHAEARKPRNRSGEFRVTTIVIEEPLIRSIMRLTMRSRRKISPAI